MHIQGDRLTIQNIFDLYINIVKVHTGYNLENI